MGNDAIVAAKVHGQCCVDPEAVKQTLTKNSFDIREQAGRLSIPTLVISGEVDKGSLFHGLDEHVTDVLCVTVAGAGHNPHRDDIGAVVEHLKRWGNCPVLN